MSQADFYYLFSENSAGRSSDADQIYKEYLQIYQYINSKIDQINQEIHDLPAGSDKKRATLLEKIQELLLLQGNIGTEPDSLYKTYLAGYSDQISFSEFEADLKQIMQKTDVIAGGSSDPFTEIQSDLAQADQIVDSLNSQITHDKDLEQILEGEIADWQSKIDNLSSRASDNSKALQDLQNTQDLLNALKEKLTYLKDTIASLQSSLDDAKQKLTTLEKLAQKVAPSAQDASQADEILNGISKDQIAFETVQADFSKNLATNAEIQAMNAAIDLVATEEMNR